MSAQLEQAPIVIAAYQADVPPRAWQEVGPQIMKALNLAGSLGLDEVRTMLKRGNATLLLAVRVADSPQFDEFVAALLVTVEQWTYQRTLCVLAAGGSDFNAWSEMMQSALVDYMRHERCKSIRALCRPGMARKLGKLGYKRVMETMEYTDGPV